MEPNQGHIITSNEITIPAYLRISKENSIYENGLTGKMVKCNGYCTVDNHNWNANMESIEKLKPIPQISEFYQKCRHVEPNQIYWENKAHNPLKSNGEHHVNVNPEVGKLWLVNNTDQWAESNIIDSENRFEIIANSRKISEVPVDCNNLYTCKRNTAIDSCSYDVRSFSAAVLEKPVFENYIKKEEFVKLSSPYVTSVCNSSLHVDKAERISHGNKSLKVNTESPNCQLNSDEVVETLGIGFVRQCRQMLSEENAVHTNLYVPPPHFSADIFNQVSESDEPMLNTSRTSNNSSKFTKTQKINTISNPIQSSKTKQCESDHILYKNQRSDIINTVYHRPKMNKSQSKNDLLFNKKTNDVALNNVSATLQYSHCPIKQVSHLPEYHQSPCSIQIKKETDLFNQAYYPLDCKTLESCLSEVKLDKRNRLREANQNQSFNMICDSGVIKNKEFDNFSVRKEDHILYYDATSHHETNGHNLSHNHSKFYSYPTVNKELKKSDIVEHTSNNIMGSQSYQSRNEYSELSGKDKIKIFHHQVTSQNANVIATKKLQSKPNYRELINHVYAMRNSTTEEDLNIKIISRALGYNNQGQGSRQAENFVSTENHCAVQSKNCASCKLQTFSKGTVLAHHCSSNFSSNSLGEVLQPIKVEDKLWSSSPLDLSLKTIKTKADSTECSFTVPSMMKKTECKYSIPKMDFTPNFSRHTSIRETKLLVGYQEKNDRNKETESKYFSDNIPSQCEYQTFCRNSVLNFAQPYEPKTALQNYNSDYSAKSPVKKYQRTSVVEENPNVLKTKSSIKCPLESKDMLNNVLTLAEHPNDDLVINPLITKENFNCFGRKRHLKEFIKYRQANEPLNKHSRIGTSCQTLNSVPLIPENISNMNFSNKITESENTPSVINITGEEMAPNKNVFPINPFQVSNESLRTIITAEKHTAEVHEVFFDRNEKKKVNQVELQKVCPISKETLTAVSEPNKSEISSISAARIRTKAELKGFTFTNNIQPVKETIPNKSEYINSPELSMSSLILSDWGNKCNDLVDQLLSHNINKRLKSRQQIKSNIADMDFSSTFTAKENYSLLDPDEIPTQSCSTDFTNKRSMVGPHDGTITRPSTCSDIRSIHLKRKISKLDREKIRLLQEKRFAAGLYTLTTSESENELNKQRTQRFIKPTKKLKSRKIFNKKKYSDCGSDSSTEGEDINKGKISDICSNNYKKVNKIAKKKKINEEEGEKKDKKESDRSSFKLTHKTMETIKKALESKNNTNKVELSNEKRNSQNAITVTRSKRKRELENQIANSKILRNDKVVRNSTTKIKRKYVKKFAKKNKSNFQESTTKEFQDKISVATRSNFKSSSYAQTSPKNNNNVLFNKKKYNLSKTKATKKCYAKPKQQKVNICSNERSKQRQTELYLEVYRYKRALKIPPSLITIKNHKISASLPDIEQELKGNVKKTQNKSRNIENNKPSKDVMMTIITNTSEFVQSEEPKSIIDLLHSRVLKTTIHQKKKIQKLHPPHISTIGGTNACNNVSLRSDLLSSTSISSKETYDTNVRSAHFSVFDTQILKSRTRTEYKMQQNKEIIREIFVGKDRPASAPPEITQPDGNKITSTYEQKYEQFLEQMNIIVQENKAEKNFEIQQDAIHTDSKNTVFTDEKLGFVDDLKDFSCISSGTQKRRKSGKHFRKKGSSGFDYIRKKKKTNHVANSHSQLFMKSVKTVENGIEKEKTEKDVCKEIQKWVLNKGVGQSTLHKAARLGYIDVIIYCLERMGLNPNQKDNAGYTPLHEACVNGRMEIARALLQYGANHSEAAHSGIRPLHEASENDHVEIVRMLLSYGADPFLATYSGQTPLMLAQSSVMKEMILNYINDIQYVGPDKQCWRFHGPWHNANASCGYDVFKGLPSFTNDSPNKCHLRRKSSNTSDACLSFKKKCLFNINSKAITNNCAVVLDNIDHFNSVRLYKENKNSKTGDYKRRYNRTEFLVETSDGEGDMFEFEEADILLPPLYLLKDEGSEKWVLLSDLCNLLKVKSKDTLLNKISPPSSISATNKTMLRELKMSDFLEKATCLQLLCSGEKINICASKVVLIKYNESVRNLLGVKTILMKF